MNGAILQQVFVVEYVVQYQMCDDCHRVEAKDFWKAVVQVRQKVRVVFYLHYLIYISNLFSTLCRYDCLILILSWFTFLYDSFIFVKEYCLWLWLSKESKGCFQRLFSIDI